MYGSKLKNVVQKPSKNKTRIKTVKTLAVIHWAACTGAQCVHWFLCKGCRTSAHYVIDQFGGITHMVDEKYVAWHAGYSKLEGHSTVLRGKDWKSLNPCSIGIELGGPPQWLHNKKYPGWQSGWPQKELGALVELLRDIKTRWPDIKLTDHSTISPGRKYDVKKGRGLSMFPWVWLLEEAGIKEARCA